MFGYVTANEPELKVKEYHEYKAYYCGLCHVLKKKYGFAGQMTLTYDMTFLIMLLTSLYECEPKQEEHRCKAHPVRPQKMLTNKFTEYAADMNILLTYHHLMDDWKDEGSKAGCVGAGALRHTYKKLKKKYPGKSRAMAYWLHRLHELEKAGEKSIDRVAGCFGKIMETILVYEPDAWEDILKRMGFFLGKFIYIMDAFDDVEKDIESGSYNALKDRFGHENFTEECNFMLNLMMAECTIEFEKLPCIQDAEILRNILYAGVWKKFDKRVQERIALSQLPDGGKKDQKQGGSRCKACGKCKMRK